MYNSSKSHAVKDEGQAFKIEVPILKAEKKDIEVKLLDGSLLLYYPGNEYTPEFKREWIPPKGVAEKDVSANYESGILTITVTKPKNFEAKIAVG